MKKLGFLILTAAGSVAVYEYLRKIGVTDQITGQLKRAVGSVTEDRSLQAEGLFETGKGKTKEFFQDAKSVADDVIDDIKNEFK